MKLADAERALQASMSRRLPGHDAFLELSGYKRPDLEAALKQAPPPRESAVLALIYERDSEAHTLLMQRPTYNGVHSGQVSFPGGRRESGDADLQSTALREFREETGADPMPARVMGAMSTIYIPPSRSLVTPFVAVAQRAGPFSPDPREVAELLEVPISMLLREDIIKRGLQHITILDRSVEVPYFDVRGRMVWGATAMMIAELRQLLGA